MFQRGSSSLDNSRFITFQHDCWGLQKPLNFPKAQSCENHAWKNFDEGEIKAIDFQGREREGEEKIMWY